MRTLAFHLSIFDEELLHFTCREASTYNSSVKRVLERVMRVIHGLPRLHMRTDHNGLDVYIGRCGQDRICERFREHRSRSHFEHGTVLFKCSTERAPFLETVGITVLQELKKEGVLCVNNANIKEDGYGSSSFGPESVVYLVWRRAQQESNYEKPTIAAIRRVVERIDERVGHEVNKMVVLNALRLAKRMTDTAPLVWAAIP